MQRTPKVANEYLMTAQEHVLTGSTPIIMPVTSEEWVTPQGILNGSNTVADVIAARRDKSWLRNPAYELGLRGMKLVPSDLQYAVRVAPLDPETGRTISDPEVWVGTWDQETKKLTPDREITSGLKDFVHSIEPDFPWRERVVGPEGQPRRPGERR